MEYGGIYYEKYDCAGPGAQTMVLLHGLTGNVSRWREYIEPLREKYNLIIPELVGHGNSYYPDKLEEYAFLAQAEKITAVLEKENARAVILVCHSYSAGIGMEILESGRILVEKVFFISPYLNDGSKRLHRYLRLINILIRPWKYLSHIKRRGKFVYPKDSDKVGRLSFQTGINEIGIKSYLANLKSCQEYTPSPKLSNRSAMLVRKNQDKISSPGMVNMIKDKFPTMREVVLAEGGHMYLLKDKKNILEALFRF